VWLGAVWLGGCLEPGAAPTHTDADARDAEVQLGTPSADTGLDFVPFEDGSDLPLETFGQGGTHVTMAVRCVGFGNRAFVEVTLTNPATGKEVTTPPIPAAKPSLLPCLPEDPQVCDLVPLFVMTGGLAAPDEKDGLLVEVRAAVRNEAGVMREARGTGVLRMQ
jgi:hypothetical protein